MASTAQSVSARNFRGPSIEEQTWIARALAKPAMFCGATTSESRIGTLRAHLVAHELGDAIAGRRATTGELEKWRQLFERVCGEPL